MGNAVHNALLEKTEGALSEKASYRDPTHGADLLAIGHKHPDRAYRCISRSMLDSNGGFDRRGWTVLNEANSKGETLSSPFGEIKIGAGDTNRIGDVVVAFMPKAQYDAKMAALAKANASIGDHIKGFKSQVKAAGGRTEGGFETQRDGISETY